MESRFGYRSFVSIAVAVLLILNVSMAGAVDELILTGIVRSVDAITSTVVIDVKSLNCGGQRTFISDRAGILGTLIGKRIRFGINSSGCGKDTYKIINYRLLGE